MATAHSKTVMRIIGGTLRSRALKGPATPGTRPTSDRVRESLFNILAHGIEDLDFEGARILDLFSGTGALGFEAISRGAKFCQFVDDDAQARGVIRDNADSLGVIGLCKIWRRDATQLGPCAPQSPYNIIFVDPPYNKGLGEKALASAVAGGWMASGAIAVLEDAERAEVKEIMGLTLIDQRTYGDTQIRLYRAA
jgi:16S rRNA (guanine966-N2)-methyltransferase